MMCPVFVQPSEASEPTFAPAPLFTVLTLLTLTLMALRHYLHLKEGRTSVSKAGNPSPGNPSELPRQDVDRLHPEDPLAVFLVGGDHSLGPASVRIFGSIYAKEFRQVLFVSVGVVDYTVLDAGAEGNGSFKGTEEAKRLRRMTRQALDPYLESAHQLGLKADCRVSVATNAVNEIDALSDEIAIVHPRAVYFVSKLVFQKPRWFHRLLHAGTSDAIRKRLENKGFPVTVLPVVLPT